MRVAVVGMGSLGMHYAFGLLGNPGLSCICVTRSKEQAQQLQRQGLTQHKGQQVLTRSCHSLAMEEWDGQADVALIAVKQTHLTEVLDELVRKPHTPSRILLFQNGLGHPEKVLERFAHVRVYAAVSTEGAQRMSAHAYRHTGYGHTWIGGLHPAATRDEVLEALLRSWSQDRKVSWSPEIAQRLWDKWFINCAINPLTALLGIPNGKVQESPELRKLVQQILAEAMHVAEKKGYQPRGDLFEQVMEVCRKTSANHSSMLQDVEKGRMTEIGALNGLLVEWAQELKVEVPVNQTLVRLIRALEKKALE